MNIRIDKIRLLATALLLMPITIRAQHLAVSNNTIACGQVAYKSPVTAEFEVSNKGGSTIKISKVKTSCGCINVTYPQGDIVAGETFAVKATFDAMTMGHFDKLIGLYAAGNDKPIELHMKGVVVSEIVDYNVDYPFTLGQLMSERNDIEFDDINRGETPQQQFHSRNNTSQTLMPQIMHLPKYIKADIAPAKLAPGHDGTVTLTLDSRLLPELGLNQTSVFLGSFPGDKVGQDKEITLSAVLLPNFEKLTARQLATAPHIELSDTKIDIPPFGNKKKQRAVIIIKNVGKSVLEIKSLRMFTSALQVSLGKARIEPGKEAKLKVTVLADMLKSARSKPRVLMITNDPDNAKVTINVNVRQQ